MGGAGEETPPALKVGMKDQRPDSWIDPGLADARTTAL